MVRRNAVIVAASLAVASIMLIGTAHAGVYQPDSGAKKGKHTLVPADYTGYGVYSFNTAGQTVSTRISAGKVKTFSFLAWNAGSSADNLTMFGCSSDGPVTIKWLDLSGAPDGVPPEEVTHAEPGLSIGQRGVSELVQPNNGLVYSMRAKVDKRFEGRGVFKCFFEVESAGAPSLTDRSLAKFKVTG